MGLVSETISAALEMQFSFNAAEPAMGLVFAITGPITKRFSVVVSMLLSLQWV